MTQSIDKLYYMIDYDTKWVNKDHVKGVPYFETILKNPEEFGKGTFNDPVILDFNSKDIDGIIEYLRNGNEFRMDDSTTYVFNTLMEPSYLPYTKAFLT